MDMTLHAPLMEAPRKNLTAGYLETLAMLERLHRLLLDVIKDEFDRKGGTEINAVQALLKLSLGPLMRWPPMPAANPKTPSRLPCRACWCGSTRPPSAARRAT
jgi:hypothetical protein